MPSSNFIQEKKRHEYIEFTIGRFEGDRSTTDMQQEEMEKERMRNVRGGMSGLHISRCRNIPQEARMR
jgi:hypothetical protein